MQKSEHDRRQFSRGGRTFPRSTVGWRALHFTAWMDDSEMTELLLRNGADPTLQSTRCQTPLHVAVYNDSDAVASKLILAASTHFGVAERKYIGIVLFARFLSLPVLMHFESPQKIPLT